jgi:hypothetical protein
MIELRKIIFSGIRKPLYLRLGHAMGQLVQALIYTPQVAGSIPYGVIGIFH